ncbi:alpha/beta hydrolase [Kibdelosporangium lantanae]
MKRLTVAMVASSTMFLAVLTAPAATAAPASSIAWGPCTDSTLKSAGAECGMLSVPVDYRRPTGKQIQLAVSRVRHKTADSAYQGVMLTNPGGPGGSGLLLSTRGSRVPNHVGDAYDWIGFDPRGVGASKPALSCDPNYFDYDRPSYVPYTPQLEQVWLKRSKGYADACRRKNDPDLLANMKTTDTVADMESIRTALGAEKMNFYGYSYGTYLGQVYATQHPDRVRRMVLDSNVDWRDVWYRSNLSQDPGFDRNLLIWFDWLASHDDTYHLGRTRAAVKNVFDEQLLKLAHNPAAGAVGPDEWLDIFQQAGYYQLRWTQLGSAFAGWVNKGDGATLKTLFEQFAGRGDDNTFAVYLAVECTDTQWPTDWNKWRVDNWVTFGKAPYFTWLNAWFNAPCVFWPAKAGKPVTVGSKAVPSMLLVDETLDAPTPYEGSLEARGRFPNSALIAEPGGTSHAITPRGNACVDDKIAAYLATGALPARRPGRTADVECQPLPLPNPS